MEAHYRRSPFVEPIGRKPFLKKGIDPNSAKEHYKASNNDHSETTCRFLFQVLELENLELAYRFRYTAEAAGAKLFAQKQDQLQKALKKARNKVFGPLERLLGQIQSELELDYEQRPTPQIGHQVYQTPVHPTRVSASITPPGQLIFFPDLPSTATEYRADWKINQELPADSKRDNHFLPTKESGSAISGNARASSDPLISPGILPNDAVPQKVSASFSNLESTENKPEFRLPAPHNEMDRDKNFSQNLHLPLPPSGSNKPTIRLEGPTAEHRFSHHLEHQGCAKGQTSDSMTEKREERGRSKPQRSPGPAEQAQNQQDQGDDNDPSAKKTYPFSDMNFRSHHRPPTDPLPEKSLRIFSRQPDRPAGLETTDLQSQAPETTGNTTRNLPPDIGQDVFYLTPLSEVTTAGGETTDRGQNLKTICPSQTGLNLSVAPANRPDSVKKSKALNILIEWEYDSGKPESGSEDTSFFNHSAQKPHGPGEGTARINHDGNRDGSQTGEPASKPGRMPLCLPPPLYNFKFELKKPIFQSRSGLYDHGSSLLVSKDSIDRRTEMITRTEHFLSGISTWNCFQREDYRPFYQDTTSLVIQRDCIQNRTLQIDLPSKHALEIPSSELETFETSQTLHLRSNEKSAAQQLANKDKQTVDADRTHTHTKPVEAKERDYHARQRREMYQKCLANLIDKNEILYDYLSGKISIDNNDKYEIETWVRAQRSEPTEMYRAFAEALMQPGWYEEASIRDLVRSKLKKNDFPSQRVVDIFNQLKERSTSIRLHREDLIGILRRQDYLSLDSNKLKSGISFSNAYSRYRAWRNTVQSPHIEVRQVGIGEKQPMIPFEFSKRKGSHLNSPKIDVRTSSEYRARHTLPVFDKIFNWRKSQSS